MVIEAAMIPIQVHRPAVATLSTGCEDSENKSIPDICVTPPVCQEVPRFTPYISSGQRRSSAPKETSVFGLPDLTEEEVDNNNSNTKEFRPRIGSGGLKGLLNSIKKSRHKSGDTQSNSIIDSAPSAAIANGDLTAEKTNKGGIKAFFRPRSQSDAAAVRNAMLRHRHISTGSQQSKATAAQADAINNNHAPVQRSRSTSWGAQEKLAMSKQMRVSGGNSGTNHATPMSQLIGGGAMPVNRKVERVKMMDLEWQPVCPSSPPQSPGLSGSADSRFTGKAFMWHRAMSVDESSRRQVQSSNAKSRRTQFVSKKWNTADVMETEFEDLVIGDPEIFNKFMKAHKCYDVIPTSAKLVVFDTQLSVKKAFFALVYNCVRAAPLWDSTTQDFVGMLTISDFIFVLTKYYKTPEATITELEEHRISTWRNALSDKYTSFISISPDASLHQAVSTLLHAKVHRLPIVDPVTGNALYTLTHKRVLKFLYLFMKHLPQPAYMSQSIEELRLGTMTNIATVTMETKLIDALNMFVDRRVSALPVLNELGQVDNIYAKFDVINLAADKSYNDLEVSVAHAIGMRKTPMEGIHSCLRTDSLKAVIEKLVRTEVHRLIIVDGENRLDGVISLSDILNYLVREDRHLSDSFSNISCSEDVFEDTVNRTGSESDDVSMCFSDLVIQKTSLASSSLGNDKMDVFPSGPLEAV